MTNRRGSPTLRRRQLGIQLRRLREQAGVTIEQVAERVECSTSKISRIETGHTGATVGDVRDIVSGYDLSAVDLAALLQLARQARQKGWWQLYGTVLTGAYVGLEAAADRVLSYEAMVVPGLLQIEDYARALIRAGRPDIGAKEIDKRIRVRMNRQSLLVQDDPIDLWVVLDEAALRRPVGGPAVMRHQLEYLVKAADAPNVTLQVLPFAVGAHAGMDGSFTVLFYDDGTGSSFAFASNAAGGLFLEKDEELQRYRFIFDHLRASALRPDEAVSMIAGLAKEW